MNGFIFIVLPWYYVQLISERSQIQQYISLHGIGSRFRKPVEINRTDMGILASEVET